MGIYGDFASTAEPTLRVMFSVVQDFTHFVIGQHVDGELIVDCPYCHRSAVRRESDMIRFIHKIRIVEAGGKTLDLDSCPTENRTKST